MKNIITTEKIPIKLWLYDIEHTALEQAKDLANLPFAFRHVPVMPDAHQGYGMPIGAVLATENEIIPNAVGVDIGCGMCSIKTGLNHLDRNKLEKIVSTLQRTIPVGFNHHDEKQDSRWMPDLHGLSLPVVEREYESATYQVGTLGGGNHFIEIQSGSDNHIWIMIHSGSRNIGLQVARHYHNLAKNITQKRDKKIPKDLSYFVKNVDKEFESYTNEMNYCIQFARNNRLLMMERVKEAFIDIAGDVTFSDFINKPHNFAAVENHFNKKLIIHRKGVTSAKRGEKGMIPGSQGTHSYIVIGKGNPETFESCSHGAGRVMSRTKARKTLNLKNEQQQLEEKGIMHAVKTRNDLDEAPSSYKDIKEVMASQEDLIEIDIELSPLAVIKG